jgi:hypothetical protein
VFVQAVAAADDGRGMAKAQQFMSSVGLGAFADQLQELKLSELLSLDLDCEHRLYGCLCLHFGAALWSY